MIHVTCPPCVVCGAESVLRVDHAAYHAWRYQGELIQVAFPNLSADDRELMMTGIHPECWEEMLEPIDREEC